MTNGTYRNFNDYDFEVPQMVRRFTARSSSDGYCTCGMKGRTRKTSTKALSFTGFASRMKRTFDWVAMGKSKKNPKDVILVFDNPDLPGAAKIYNYKNKTSQVGTMSHVVRFFDMLGVKISGEPDSSVSIRFDLKETAQPGVYEVQPLEVVRVDSNGKRLTQVVKKQQPIESEVDFVEQGQTISRGL